MFPQFFYYYSIWYLIQSMQIVGICISLFGRPRPLTRGGDRLASLSNHATSDDVRHLPPGRQVEQTSWLDSSAKPLPRLSRSAWKCVHLRY